MVLAFGTWATWRALSSQSSHDPAQPNHVKKRQVVRSDTGTQTDLEPIYTGPQSINHGFVDFMDLKNELEIGVEHGGATGFCPTPVARRQRVEDDAGL